MQRRMLGERASVPELDAWMAQASDTLLAAFAERLSVGFDEPHARALVALALDFWTWQRSIAEGLDDDAAAALMSGVVATAPRLEERADDALVASRGARARRSRAARAAPSR